MRNRFVVAIPVYNNPGTILAVLEACLSHAPFPVIVIDDGSDISVESICRSELTREPKMAQRISFVRHPENKGKGVALQTAFRTALSKGYTHMIAIDGDGQHAAEDIMKLTQAADEHPWALIVGDRNMQTEHVPKSSVFGKKFSNFWVNYQTGKQVGDSQSGFRIYPLFQLQNMKFFCTKYEFEIEVLIRLIWKGVQVKNVPVYVKYYEPGERVSHFHKFRDNFRISVLNSVLVIAAMFREQTSPLKSSLALGAGVFIGSLPIYGLHTGVAAVLAFVFRMNFLYLWVGTNISIPPMIPILILGSNYLGSYLTGQNSTSLATAGNNLILGSVALGLILGSFAFALNYIFKTTSFKTKKAKAWTGKNQNKLGIQIMRFFLKTFGVRFAYFNLYFVVFYYYLFSFRTHRSLTEYWKVIRPDLGFLGRQRRIYQQILIFSQALVDRGIQKEHDELYFQGEMHSSTDEFIHALRTKPDGIMIACSHIGGWELALAFFSKEPTEKRMLTIMHGIPGQPLHQSVKDGASKSDAAVFNVEGNTILRVKDYLSKGDVTGMMADRPMTASSELVPFFGKLALFDTTPFRTAMACKVDMYAAFVVKEKGRKYRIFTFRLEPGLGSKDVMIDNVLKQYVQRMEETLREYPTQWFNFFPFWSETRDLNS